VFLRGSYLYIKVARTIHLDERAFTNLTPYIPLSFKGEGEEIYREG